MKSLVMAEETFMGKDLAVFNKCVEKYYKNKQNKVLKK
jgi:hypothetical protein